jgi:type IV secretory pathway VirB4 component
MAISAQATQDFVPIKDVKDGVVILKDGGLRGILMTSSVNFSLKSEDEKTAIVYQFQDFLNSLDFSVQILIQSRKHDIRPYIALLEDRKKEQMNDLLKIQIQEYIEFIKAFTERQNIMTKNFFVVVPYTPNALDSGGSLNKFLPKSFSKELGGKTKNAQTTKFEEDIVQLDQRLAVVSQGLSRCSIRTVRLGTEEIIELFYKVFNPGETEKPIQMNT